MAKSGQRHWHILQPTQASGRTTVGVLPGTQWKTSLGQKAAHRPHCLHQRLIMIWFVTKEILPFFEIAVTHGKSVSPDWIRPPGGIGKIPYRAEGGKQSAAHRPNGIAVRSPTHKR